MTLVQNSLDQCLFRPDQVMIILTANYILPHTPLNFFCQILSHRLRQALIDRLPYHKRGTIRNFSPLPLLKKIDYLVTIVANGK